MAKQWLALVVITILSWPSAVAAGPLDQSVYESFEAISPNTIPGVSFDVGTSPEKATFSGNAFAGVVGIGTLYHQAITPGNKSWMVLENSVGRVDFDLHASAVEFYARTHPNADGNTVISAFDGSDAQVGSTVTLQPGDPWTLVSFAGNIDHVLVDNRATNNMNGIDDFGFTAVPEPSTVSFGTLTIFSLLIRRRRQSQQ